MGRTHTGRGRSLISHEGDVWDARKIKKTLSTTESTNDIPIPSPLSYNIELWLALLGRKSGPGREGPVGLTERFRLRTVKEAHSALHRPGRLPRAAA